MGSCDSLCVFEESKMAGTLPTVAKRAGQVATRQVKPLLSLDKDEARVRVLALYRAWYRQIPILFQYRDMPVTEESLRAKLKEEFLRNAHIKDVRGQQELQELAQGWQEAYIVLSKWFKEK